MAAKGATVKRIKPGLQGEHGKGLEPGGPVDETGVVTREFSWKWMKVEINGEAQWVRCEEFEEV